jgi:hypothetical protein
MKLALLPNLAVGQSARFPNWLFFQKLKVSTVQEIEVLSTSDA